MSIVFITNLSLVALNLFYHEVYEHLPLSYEKFEKLFNEHTVWVFLTIPSIGIDPYNGRSIFNESSPYRIEDMSQNKLFSYLAVMVHRVWTYYSCILRW